MGYPPGGRGYRLRSLATNHFFNSGNVIFDETTPYRAMHEIPSSANTYDSLPFESCSSPPARTIEDSVSPSPSVDNLDNSSHDSISPTVPDTIVTPPSPRTASPPPRPTRSPLRRSSRERKLTEKGVAQVHDLDAKNERLLKIRMAAEERKSRTPEPGPSHSQLLTENPPVIDDENPFSSFCDAEIFSHSSSDSSFATLDLTSHDKSTFSSLDVEDYLQRDTETIIESIFLSIRSDTRRNPTSPGYDLSVPPVNHNEAMQRPDADEWRKVEMKEFGMLKDMGVYREEMLPEGRKAIGSRWVFEFKMEAGKDPLAKGRLVAQGFSQIPFIDYAATFAPVAKSVSVRFIAVYSAMHGWFIECLDATRAFLWGELTRTIYLRYPQGYTPSLKGGVWRLLKSLYGLKQASRVWYKLLRSVLEKLGFVRSEFDHAVFIFKGIWSGHDVHCILAMHVDDGLAGCNSRAFLDFIKAEIGKAFGIKDLGPLHTFLGVQFERNLKTREIWIHQETYIAALLEEYQLTDCNPVSTPLDPHHPFGVDTDVHPAVENLLRAFQRLIGSLLFLQRFSRPDLSVTMLLLSQFCSNPEPRHFAAAKRVLRYLKGTKSLRLHYGGAKRSEVLSGLTDADWALNRSDRASISGYIWSFAGGPVSWSAKKQNCIALSSTEAEYIALTRAVQEGIWLRASLTQLHISVPSPLIISTDNNGALSLSENDSSHSRAKHIDIRYHFIRSHVEHGHFLVKHIPGVINSADLFTKLLHRVKFHEHIARIGLVCR
jgi:hypothetical protein